MRSVHEKDDDLPYAELLGGSCMGLGNSIFDKDRPGFLDQNRRWADPVKTSEDKWLLLPAFLKTKGIFKQHINSFNHFIDVEIKQIVLANSRIDSDVDPNFWLEFKDMRIKQPQAFDVQKGVSYDLFPNECRLRDLTYAGNIVVDIEYVRGRQLVKKRGVEVGRMPIMLRSNRCFLNSIPPSLAVKAGECPLDPGGYFIVRGAERVLLIQEQMSKNRVIVEKGRQGAIIATVVSSTREKKSKTDVLYYGKAGKVYLKHNSIVSEVPVVIVMKAFGVESDKEIVELVCGDNAEYIRLFMPSVEDCVTMTPPVFTQNQALSWLGKKFKPSSFVSRYPAKRNLISETQELLASTVLAHIPIETTGGKPNMMSKAVYLALMIHRTLRAVTEGGIVDDRDFVGNKRLELASQLLSLLFEDLFKSWTANIKRAIDMQLQRTNRTQQYDASTAVSQTSRILTDGLFRAISTGNWTLKRFRMERAGVTQVLSRLSYISALGMLTRINSQFEKTRKVSGPRSLQMSQYGIICPSDTPEGEACGLVKNLALTAHITTDVDAEPIKKLLFTLGIEDISFVSGTDIHGPGPPYVVILNGVIIGAHYHPEKLVCEFRTFRRAGKIDSYVSIYKDPKFMSVNVSSDAGRACRPFIIVENGKPLYTREDAMYISMGIKSLSDIVSEGKIEYMDVNEESDALIAIDEKSICYLPKNSQEIPEEGTDVLRNTTHMEITPFSPLGAVAGLIPYPDHNQSPRNTYQCAMGKQAIGAIAYNQFSRIDTLLYLLVYPQKPLVKTKIMDLISYEKLPAGQNATVAVMSYSGYDIEDALVFNKASLDRGLGRCQVMRKFGTTIKMYPNQTYDRLADPPRDQAGKILHNFAALDADGLPNVGIRISTGQILINKQSPSETTFRVHPTQDPSDPSEKLSTAVAPVDITSIPYKSTPIVFKYPDSAAIDQVLLTTNHEDRNIVKVLVRQTRRPEIGDKFSSRHGQKGVCGVIVNQEDMPFTETGIIPDIIMNPHGFPSRMTVGKMIELISGKAGCIRGEFKYGTAFENDTVDMVSKELVEAGYSYCGKDFLTSGITGVPLQAYIFMGPIYYQKLKHMVMDKMHARSRGPRAVLTRQPTEGRSRDGGLRVGEMERDCLISHGTSSLLVERLMRCSDAYQCEICTKCGLMLSYLGCCSYCKSREQVSKVSIPYAAKLLFQELMSMNVIPRFQVGELS